MAAVKKWRREDGLYSIIQEKNDDGNKNSKKVKVVYNRTESDGGNNNLERKGETGRR